MPVSVRLQLDEERLSRGKEYSNTVLFARLLSLTLLALAALASLVSSISVLVEEWAGRRSVSPDGVVFLYTFAGYIIIGTLGLPLRVLRHKLDRAYGIDNLSWPEWIGRWLTFGFFRMLYILPGVTLLYWAIRTYGQVWWLVAWVVLAIWIVARTYLESVITVPYLLRPVQPPPPQLRDTLAGLAARGGIKAPGVEVITTRKSVPRAIVAFSGLGNTERIFVNNRFLARYTSDEIEGVIAHELGHRVRRDTAIRLLLTLGISAAGLFLANSFVQAASGLFGIPDLSRVATLPLFVIFFVIFRILTDAIRNSVTRRQELKADSYASSLTDNPMALSTALVKMHHEGLGDARPHRLVEIFLYTHPSLLRRVKGLLGYDPSALPDASRSGGGNER